MYYIRVNSQVSDLRVEECGTELLFNVASTMQCHH